MIVLIALAMMLHPGHMTRVEIRASDDAKSIELAMRIDALDLESALKARAKKPIDVGILSDEQAQELVGSYIRNTITVNSEKLTDDQFHWVGWERKTRHVWVYFELPISLDKAQALELRIKTLFEVEPAIQHVIVLAKNVGDRSEILLNADQAVSIKRIVD